MEKIISIQEATFKSKENDYSNYDGYIVKTEKQEIKLGIYNSQCCCEQWGYFMSNDDFSNFIGSNLISVEITDTCLNNSVLEKEEINEGECMFVNINTSKGLLQFVAYNSHNGYYGHDAIVISEQLNHTEML